MTICPCRSVPYQTVDYPVRKFLKRLHEKNICTHSSEGGGHGHGAPDYAYVEVYLTRKNLSRMKSAGFILDKVFDKKGRVLFFGSALQYGRKTGFHLLGMNRKGLTDTQVEKRLCNLVPLLEKQNVHRTWQSF